MIPAIKQAVEAMRKANDELEWFIEQYETMYPKPTLRGTSGKAVLTNARAAASALREIAEAPHPEPVARQVGDMAPCSKCGQPMLLVCEDCFGAGHCDKCVETDCDGAWPVNKKARPAEPVDVAAWLLFKAKQWTGSNLEDGLRWAAEVWEREHAR